MKNFKLFVHIIVIKIILKNFLRWFIGVSFEQQNKMTNLKQCIFVANHNSHLDTACFLSIIPIDQFLSTHPIAAKDYFSKYAIIEKLVKLLFNVVLIDRKALKSLDGPLKIVHETLKSGHSILFFPEGSRGVPEIMGEFKSGIAVILKAHPQIPFVPIYMRGLGKAMPKGDPLLIPHESKILIGEPILISDIQNLTNAEIAKIVRDSITILGES